MSLYPEARFVTSAARAAQFLPDEGAEVAFAGRSNAGKSSAINAVVGRRDFARTSKTPGRTQLINFFELGRGQRLVDLPGYGYARVSDEMREHWRELLGDYFGQRKSLAGLMVVVDSRRGIGDFDRQMLGWGGTLGCRLHVLLTKADKLSRRECATTLTAAEAELRELPVTVQLFSATSRLGLDAARAALAEMLGGDRPQ
ncbi:MAG: ribosome biogenesis GTP-binding protein YihA/YsxC [Gammaproteobacteria bacterium]|nr:ribosome biogenesis GTP-binding protein YihA/YsxC [Gammaproteobacteria bacterium]MDH5275786.1 ribosome biogenesis GTP-binding protein YihA/YsxC [Gammaproteobacteria bacterium]